MATISPARPLAAADILIGDSPPMAGFRQRLRTLLHAEQASGPMPRPAVLIVGETGAGKGLAARTLHDEGAGPSSPFVRVDCAGWTGAIDLPPTGTVFLDEVGECPPGCRRSWWR